MKKIFTMITIFIVGTLIGHATIRVVDGVGASSSGRYAKIADAVTAAVTNDTVVVLPGTYREADVTIDKKLTILGSGYREIKNGGTHIMNVWFTIADAADGTKIQGFRFLGNGIGLNANADNCLIANNYFLNAAVNLTTNNGDTIRNNMFVATTAINMIYSSYNVALQNIVIANNIMSGSAQTNNAAAIFLRAQTAYQTNIQIINNFIEKYSLIVHGDWTAFDGMILAGNIFHKVANIVNAANNAQLYSGNWKFNCPVTAVEPANALDKSSGDLSAMFTRFDQGFDFKDTPSTDTDLRFKSTTTPFPDSPIDGSATAVAPLGNWYVDYLQQPGTSNGNRADGGIYGGPYTFPSNYGGPILPSVTNISISPAVASPNGTIQINATGTVSGFPGRNN